MSTLWSALALTKPLAAELERKLTEQDSAAAEFQERFLRLTQNSARRADRSDPQHNQQPDAAEYPGPDPNGRQLSRFSARRRSAFHNLLTVQRGECRLSLRELSQITRRARRSRRPSTSKKTKAKTRFRWGLFAFEP